MRKFILTVAVLSMLVVPCFVLAAGDSYGLGTAAGTAGLQNKSVAGGKDIPSIVGGVVGVGLSLLGVAFFLLLLYAGFIWMTAMGDKGKIDRAKDILESAIIGLVIVVAAYAIANFVFSNIVGGGAGGTAQSGGAGTSCTSPAFCTLADNCSTIGGTNNGSTCANSQEICCQSGPTGSCASPDWCTSLDNCATIGGSGGNGVCANTEEVCCHKP